MSRLTLLVSQPFSEGHPSEEAEPEEVRMAVENERTRQWGKKKPRLSKDSEERHLQQVGPDVPRALAKSIVREERRKRQDKMNEPKD
jgi:hypothetical protein